jgi:hypothetical protein
LPVAVAHRPLAIDLTIELAVRRRRVCRLGEAEPTEEPMDSTLVLDTAESLTARKAELIPALVGMAAVRTDLG